jgi:hypothetical protein
MHRGEIFLAKFPFGDMRRHEASARPFVNGNHRTSAGNSRGHISSVVPAQLLASDLLMDTAKPEFQAINPKVLSTLRLYKRLRFICQASSVFLESLMSTRLPSLHPN